MIPNQKTGGGGHLRTRTVLGMGVALAVLGALGSALALTTGGGQEPAAIAKAGTLRVAPQVTPPPSGSSWFRGSKIAVAHAAGTTNAVIGGTEEILGPLTASLVPVAVRSEDGSTVAYSTWQQLGPRGVASATGTPLGRPSLRVFASAEGRDLRTIVGAHAPTLSPDGRLAFLEGKDPIVRMNTPYIGQVMVGNPQDPAFEPWTTEPARYLPYGWAAGTLLVYKGIPESEGSDIYAFSGPGVPRLLAPSAAIVAISPDGLQVLVATDDRALEVIRVADGAVTASLRLDGLGVAAIDSTTTPHYVQYSGSWLGDRVVANSDLGLILLAVPAGTIRIETILATPDLPHGIVEPTFVDAAHVRGWADITISTLNASPNEEPGYDNALVSCDLDLLTCTRGEASPPLPGLAGLTIQAASADERSLANEHPTIQQATNAHRLLRHRRARFGRPVRCLPKRRPE